MRPSIPESRCKMQLIRAPVLPPETATPHPLPKPGADGRQPVIRINHPGYPPPGNELITVPALDPLPRTQTEREERRQQFAPVRQAVQEAELQREEAGDIDVDVGLHHGTVLTICGIIADNAFERVFLSHDADGLSRVDDRWQYDDIIPAGVYWLQVTPMPSRGAPAQGGGIAAALGPAPAVQQEPVNTISVPSMPPPPPPPPPRASRPYPIVANFESWRFPHDRLPASWSKADEPPTSTPAPGIAHPISERIRTLQSYSTSSCVISAHSIAVEQAHVVPKACADWFTQNGMRCYNDPSPQQLGRIDQPRNKIGLRSDLHTFFDSRHLVIIPKPVFVQPPVSSVTHPAASPPALSQYALAVHMLSTPAYEVIPLYHNLALQYRILGNGTCQQYSGSREFLFARFAWSIFRLLQGFLDAERWVLVRARQSRGHSLVEGYEYKWASNASLKTTPSSRSSSKRPASEMAQGESADSDEPGHRSKRRRLRPAAELLTTGEELDENEIFQLDEGQYLQYEAMRRRAEREAERELEEQAALDDSNGLDHGKSETYEDIMRWRAQTSDFSDVGDIEANSPPDLSFTESHGSNRSSASLSHPEVHDHRDGNDIAVDDPASKASRISSVNDVRIEP